jgi:hypothetical protein
MTRTIITFIVTTLIVSAYLFPVPADFAGLDITIGNVRIPKAFIHAGKEYNRGIYWITVKEKNGAPHFYVHNRKKELLFEELAVLKLRDYKGKAKKLRHWVSREFLKGYEFFRIKVSRADSYIIAYLLVNQKKVTPMQKKNTPEVNIQ